MMRAVAGQKLVEQNAEAVHISGGRHALTAHLFGTGIVGRHRAQARDGLRGPGLRVGIHELGYAKV